MKQVINLTQRVTNEPISLVILNIQKYKSITIARTTEKYTLITMMNGKVEEVQETSEQIDSLINS